MDDLNLAITAARRGGAVVREAFGRQQNPHFKGRFDPVTEIDHRSEQAILATIGEHRPDDSVLAEESGRTEGGERVWIIDPLDGTVNYVHGIPHVAVSVALYQQNEALAGAIFDPLRDEVFAAAVGNGSSLNGEAVAVSSVSDLERSVVATGFPYDHGTFGATYARVLGSVLQHVNGIRRFGSAALDLAWVAAGRYEGYWELGIAPWDQAAGSLIVREAGGIVTDPHGEGVTPFDPLVVAAGPGLHPDLRRIVADSLPGHLR